MNPNHRSFHLSKNFILWMAATLPVIILTIINIYTGHLLLAFLMVIFCISAVIIRRSNFVLLLAPVVLMLIFKAQPLNTFGNFREQFTALMSKPGEYLGNLFTPNTGTEVLPEEALYIHKLIDQFDLIDYWLTDGLQENNEIKEKIIESSWPVIIDSASPYVFSYRGEFADRDGCNVIGTQLDIELGYCD